MCWKFSGGIYPWLAAVLGGECPKIATVIGKYVMSWQKSGSHLLPSTILVKGISTHVFAFILWIQIYSSMKVNHVNRTYLAQQIVRCYDQ